MIASNKVEIDKIISNVEDTTNEARLSSIKVKDTTYRLEKFSSDILTPEMSKNIVNYINVQNENSMILVNEVNKIAEETNKSQREIRERLYPAIDKLPGLVDAGIEVVQEVRQQVKQNGDSANALIVSTNDELKVILKELSQTSKNITILTNDPNIPLIIENLKVSAEGVSKNLSNIEIITANLAALSDKLITPIINPPKQTGIKKILVPLYRVFRFVNASGNLLLLIERLSL